MTIACITLAATTASAPAFADDTTCAAIPPANPDVTAVGYYTDPQQSIIDPVLYEENKEDIAPLTTFTDCLARMSDHYLNNPADTADANSILSWLDNWASNGAMLGKMVHINNHQADFMRQWTHGTAAIAYLKTRPLATADQRQRIEGWLKTLSADTLQYWQDPNNERNNHFYWTGVGVMATALATNDANLLAAAQAIYREGIDDIQSNGSLPFELRRGRLALHYTSFAAAPLVLMAEMAHEWGYDWYSYHVGSLESLTQLIASGYRDSSWFDAAAGTPQTDKTPTTFSGWVEFYRQHSTNPAAFDAMHNGGPYIDTWMGGNLTMMAQRGIAPGSSPAGAQAAAR